MGISNENKVTLVTDANRGIDKAIVEAAYQSFSDSIVMADFSE